MNAKKLSPFALILALTLVFPALVVGQTARQQEEARAQEMIARADEALRRAEAAGAPVYASPIHEEARTRADWARMNFRDNRAATRREAAMRAEEAFRAAEAAEAISRHTAGVRQASGLREDIVRFGGTAPPLALLEFPMAPIQRGANSRERIAFARQVIAEAESEGARLVAPADMETARLNLGTADQLTRRRAQNPTADHLAYVSEMLARRAWALARGGDVDRVLPGLRMERTRLAQEVSEREAVAERQRREAAEREAIELRRRIDQEASARRMQEQELAALRQQVAMNEQRLLRQLEEDRQARLDAERRLTDLRAEQERLRTADPVEMERLRRQVEDQALVLRQFTERERESERAMQEEIARLRTELAQQRREGVASEALAAREAELRQREQEIARLQREREAAEAELAQARRAEQERMAELQRALAEIAETRADERGLTVILPGIYFDVGRSELTSGARAALTRIAAQLRANERVRILVVGHTDSTGGAQLNMNLSQQRAAAVRNFLVQQGIAAGQITAEGRGQDEPIATNATAAGRQQNRRVELLITQ